MRKFVPILLLALGACTPDQHYAFIDWLHRDPQAAVDFVENGCGPLDCTVEWEDVTTTEDEADIDPGVGSDGIYWPWDELAQCESGGDWHISTGNGYYGGLQFALGSWHAAGGSGYPHEHSPSEQIRRGEILQDMQGWNAWPTCARIIGLI